jgi:adenylate cyclase
MLFKKQTWHWPHIASLITCGIVAAFIPILLDLLWEKDLLEPIEFKAVDMRFKRRPLAAVLEPVPAPDGSAQTVSNSIVALDYDNKASSELGLGRWPWDRRVHAQVFDMLKKAGARSVLVDIVFDHPVKDPAEDRAMIEATRQAGIVILPVVFKEVEGSGTDEFFTKAPRHLLHAEVEGFGYIPGVGELSLPLPGLIDAAAGLGHIQSTTISGAMRRTPLLYATKGGFVPSMALVAALRDLEVDPATIRLERGKAIRFKPRLSDEVVIPINKQGRVWINYAGEWGKRFVHYPYSWVQAQMKSPAHRERVLRLFKDKHVLLSNLTTVSGSDVIATPFEDEFPTSEAYLHILNMILTKQFLRNATTGELVVCYGLPIALLTASALAGGPMIIIPTFLVVTGIYTYTLQHMFNTQSAVLPAAGPLLSLTLGLVFLLLTRFFIVDRERVRFQSVLGTCLPPHTLKIIKDSPGMVATLLAGHSRELVILFADIKGFSVYCKKADALQIQRVLRDYLTAMTAIILEHGGTLDKYMGDGIMAFFGDAEPEGGGEAKEEDRVERNAASAVRTALAMQRKMAELNASWMSLGQEPHLIRIGINTGTVTVGNLGTEYLMDYTVIGPEVNKAQRLESAAEPGGILLARRTYALARKQGVLPEDLPPKVVNLKGIGEEPDAYPVPPEIVAQLTMVHSGSSQ